MKDILRLTLALVVIASASGLTVGMTQRRTKPAIEEQNEQARTEALRAVLPDGADVEERRGTGELPSTYWVGLRDGEVVAYAFRVVGRGYSSDIRMMVGVDTGGVILGVSIIEQKETPGLGTRIDEVATKRYIWSGFGEGGGEEEPWFTEQFEGMDLDERLEIVKQEEWHALDDEQRARLERENEVCAVTGATISTRAVVRGLETTVFPYLRALREDDTP